MNKLSCREQLNKRNIDYGNKVQRIKLLRENLFILKDDCKIDYKNGKKTLRGRRVKMKFKRNDKAWFHDQKAVVTAVVMEAARSYGVAYRTPKGKIKHTTTVETQLEKRKTKHDLEQGDNVIDVMGRLIKITDATTFNGVKLYKGLEYFDRSDSEIYLTPDFIEEVVFNAEITEDVPREER
jgi:hypothetical protein